MRYALREVDTQRTFAIGVAQRDLKAGEIVYQGDVVVQGYATVLAAVQVFVAIPSRYERARDSFFEFTVRRRANV